MRTFDPGLTFITSPVDVPNRRPMTQSRMWMDTPRHSQKPKLIAALLYISGILMIKAISGEGFAGTRRHWVSGQYT